MPDHARMVRYSTGSTRSVFGLAVLCVMIATLFMTARAQDPTADDEARIQRDISFQQSRLNNADPEVRRDAVLRLGAMRRPDASRAATPALGDVDESVRAAACAAVVSMAADEAVDFLLPLLHDKRPFIRQEAAYAFGELQKSQQRYLAKILPPLVVLLASDPYLNVRAAAALAFGRLRVLGGLDALEEIVSGNIKGKIRDRSETEYDFLRRCAAIALGQIGQRSSVPALIAVLNNRDETPDTRREAARALGLIGDPSADSALRSAVNDRDPYLAEIAFDALQRTTK